MTSKTSLKIDMHSHILPKQWPNLADKYGVPGFPSIVHEQNGAKLYKDGKFFRAVTATSWDTELRINDYAKHAVDVQVVSTVPIMFCYWAKAKHCLELSQFLNNHIAELCQQYPKNIIGLGSIPLQDPDMAITEMERCKHELGFAGLQIGSHVNQWNLDHSKLFPVFEAAESLGMALLVHPWEMMGSESMSKYWLPWLVGMPAEVSRAICSMIFGGVLERLPKLRVCFSHGGGSFPFTVGRIEQGFTMRPDLVAIDNAVNPRDYLKRIYIDSITHDPKALSYLIDVMDPQKIMLGTDYPFPLGEQNPGAMIDALSLPTDLHDSMMCHSALRWLNLSIDDFS